MSNRATIYHERARVIDGSDRHTLGHFGVRCGKGADRFTYSVDAGDPEMTMPEAFAAAMDWISERMGMGA